jgi:Protein of unknown function (DUF2442)
MLRRIESVAVRGVSQLELAFAGGEPRVVDLKPLIQRGGVFAALADPAVFGTVRLGPDGRYVEWPDEDLDLCADALWLEASQGSGHEAA